ncbi:MAG: cyclophilin-like fold protein [Pseudomonadota bacterium]
MRYVLIRASNVAVRVKLRDTATADAIWNALPIYGQVQTWGEEVYFSAAVEQAREPDAKAVVDRGEVAYWPDGQAIAIGFGPTPISKADEIRLTSPCNIWADAVDDVGSFKSVEAGTHIAVIEADS